MMKRLFVMLFGFFFTTQLWAQNYDYIKIDHLTRQSGSATPGWNEVYGKIHYEVNLTQHKVSAENSLESFLKNRVRKLFGGKDGNYVLTLSIYNGVREISKKAVVTFTWSTKKILFLTVNESLTNSISYSGQLIDHFPISSNNNKMQAKLVLERMEQVRLDPETYNAVSSRISLLKYSSLQPSIVLTSALQTTLEVMSKIINSTEKRELSADVALMFLPIGGDFPSNVSFKVRGPSNNGTYLNGIDVNVYLTTQDSLIGKYEEGRFIDLDLNTLPNKAIVGASGAGIPFEEAISGESHKDIRTYLLTISAGKLPEDVDVGDFCSRLWSVLLEFYSDRDAPALYAAYLRKYDRKINQENAENQCVERYRKTIEKLGIDLSEISIQQ